MMRLARALASRAAQAGARDVFEPGQVEHQRGAFPGTGLDVRLEVGLERLAALVVEPTLGSEDAGSGEVAVRQRHVVRSVYVLFRRYSRVRHAKTKGT
jgi:hypothetical protein